MSGELATAATTTRRLGRLDVQVDRTATGCVVTLAGQIDDQAALEAVAAELPVERVGEVVIDLDGVRFINSIGVREWIGLLRRLDARGARVTLRRCSEPMVHQMNMVMEARGDATIESFHVPYVCDVCGGTASRVLPVAAHEQALRARKVPPQPCSECGGAMQFDDFPNRYLLFLD